MSKTKTIVLTILFFIICGAVFLFFGIFTKNSDFTSEILPLESFSFTADSGGVTEYDLDSDYGTPRLDGVYTAVFTLPEFQMPTYLYLLFGTGEIKLWLNQALVYSGEIWPYDHLTDIPVARIAIDESNKGNRLTAEIRYNNLESNIFPALVRAEAPQREEQRTASAANIHALPAGIAGAVFLLVAGLFLISVALSRPDFSLLLLASSAGLCCTYLLLRTGAVMLPSFPLLLDILAYLPPVLVLLYAVLNWKKHLLTYFLSLSAALAAIIAAAYFLAQALDPVPWFVTRTADLAVMIRCGEYDQAVSIATTYLLLIGAAAALIEHSVFLSRLFLEKSMLEAQSAAVASGYANIVNNAKYTEEVRHEWKNDLLTLDIFYQQGRFDELGEYLKKKNDQLDELSRMTFTENFVFDVILNSASARARLENIPFEASLHIPKVIHMRDEDLCSLLMNMLNNAFAACRLVEEPKRFIRFRAVQNEAILAITCSNSSPAADPKPKDPDDLSHGWGLKIMKAVCQRYGSDLLISRSEDTFTVKTALQLHEDEAAG